MLFEKQLSLYEFLLQGFSIIPVLQYQIWAWQQLLNLMLRLKLNVMRPLLRLSTIAQESQQSASRGRVLAFYRIVLCINTEVELEISSLHSFSSSDNSDSGSWSALPKVLFNFLSCFLRFFTSDTVSITVSFKEDNSFWPNVQHPCKINNNYNKYIISSASNSPFIIIFRY